MNNYIVTYSEGVVPVALLNARRKVFVLLYPEFLAMSSTDRIPFSPYLVDLENAFFNRPNYYFHTTPVQRFTSEETRALADLEVNLNRTRDEFYSRFIVGQLNANNDRDWNNYLDTMRRMGLDRVIQIRTAAYNRSR